MDYFERGGAFTAALPMDPVVHRFTLAVIVPGSYDASPNAICGKLRGRGDCVINLSFVRVADDSLGTDKPFSEPVRAVGRKAHPRLRTFLVSDNEVVFVFGGVRPCHPRRVQRDHLARAIRLDGSGV